MTGWILVTVALIGGLAVLMGIFLVLWLPVAALLLFEVMWRRRVAQQYALLWLLTISAERGMPLGPAIQAFAQERRGMYSQRARRLAALLAEGVSLPAALARCRGLLPSHAGPMIRVGCQSGDLATALRQAASTRNLYAPVWFSLAGKLTYLCLMSDLRDQHPQFFDDKDLATVH